MNIKTNHAVTVYIILKFFERKSCICVNFECVKSICPKQKYPICEDVRQVLRITYNIDECTRIPSGYDETCIVVINVCTITD